MPRYVVNESEDETEPKTGRRTRAALAASTTDSPIRRSTRIRHGSVNPDGSSPESVSGAAATQVTRVTRRRASAAAVNTLTVPEPTRTLRSRKNSASSNVSENIEIESAPSTPKTRTLRRLSIVESSPGESKLATRTRRSTRASSETKSPPPVVRTTRRTRATSIDPEPTVDRTATPTKKRRQPVSALPSEPSLTEEANEDKAAFNIDKVDEIPELENEDASSPDKTLSETSRRSSPASAKKLSKNGSAKDQTAAEVDIDESIADKSPEKTLAAELSSPKNESGNITDQEFELLKTPVEEQVGEVTAKNVEAENSPIVSQSLVVKTKRHSLDKSKELGMKIEDLLNKSTEEQETSPGNKENQKLNVSPDKVKKNIEFTVSSVSIARRKSIGSLIFANKPSERKNNTSLDELVLSKPRFGIVAPKSIQTGDNEPIDFQDSNADNKSQAELPSDVRSAKKNESEEVGAAKQAGLKSGYTKIEETIVENEIIEEFTLYDSNDDSKSEFSLTVEDDEEDEKITSFSNIASEDKALEQPAGDPESKHSDGELESDSDSDIVDKPNPSRYNSRKNSSEVILREKESEPKRRFSLNSKQAEEAKESPSKQDKRRKSKENKEASDVKTPGDVGASDIEVDAKSKKNIEEEEPMDTNEEEETETKEKSPVKQSLDQKEKPLKVKDPKSKSSDQVSDSDSNMVIDNLFHNISAEEWNNKQKNQSPKETKKRASLKSREDPLQETRNKADTEEDLILFEEESREEIGKAKGSDKEAADSDDTLILKTADSPEKTNKKRRSSSSKMIVEEAESEETEIEGKKFRRSNTSMESKIEAETKNTNSIATSQDQGADIDENISEAETIPTNIDHLDLGGEETEEEKRPVSSKKNTPKNKKNKSPATSLKKSKKSADVYDFEDSLEGEEEESTDEEEKTAPTNLKGKSLRSKKERGSALDRLKTPLGRNYSIVAVVDSDSGPDIPSSDNNSEHSMPGYLFTVESSGDEKESPGTEKDESNNTINSDIEKEMNLAGDDDLKYSDDDVPGDECRASEEEHSDEEDAGSDIDSFIVADDDVESSLYSEEEAEPKTRFKRILDKSSSEEEEGEAEKSDDEIEMKAERKSLRKTPDQKEIAASKSPELEAKKLNFSFDSEKALSGKKSKMGKAGPDLESPKVEDLEIGDKKLKKFLNTTIDLCTPVQDATAQDDGKTTDPSPGLNTSGKKNKSLKKLRKCLVEDLGTSTPEGNDLTQEDEEDEPMFTPKTKTPSKEKKTPKSAKKSPRDSIQQIEVIAALEETELELENEEEEEAKKKTPSKEKKTPKSAKKSQRESIQQIEVIAALEETKLEPENEEEEEPKKKTPSKEKKTPKSAKKSQRNSIQLEETELELENEEEEELKKKTPSKEQKTPKSAKKSQRNSIQLEETELEPEDVEEEPKTKTPSKEKKTQKSAKKSQRNSIQQIEETTALHETELEPEDAEEEPMFTPKTKTPRKEKKTPKSGRKNERDSIQLIEEVALVSSKVSDLNKTMLTPNSESPVTKFLKKERLNESLPLLELKKRASRSFDKKALSRMTEDEQEPEDQASEIEEQKEIAEESEEQESDADDDAEENEEVNTNGHKDDEEEEDETDEGSDKEEEENEDVEENEEEPEDEESEESSEEEVIMDKKKRRLQVEEKNRKSGGRKSLNELEEPLITPGKKQSAKRQSIGSTSASVNGKKTELNENGVTPTKKNISSDLPNKKKRSRLETSDTPQGLKETKKMKIAATLEAESDSDEGPESLGFVEARTEALQEMKEVAASLKAAKEAKKQKRRDQLERIKQEKEAKAGKKGKSRPEIAKNNLKRLPEDLLDNLSEVAQRPKKKRKLLKKEEPILPSRYMFSPEKLPLHGSLNIEECSTSLSTGGGTTHFSVVNLEKVKKAPKKAAAVASFRERMLARNPRQPVSAFLMYQAKQKASGKQLASRKQA